MKCEACGMTIDKQPCLSNEGKCTVCGKKLTAEQQSKS